MENWTKITSVNDLVQANLINAALHAENIDTALINRKDSALVFLGHYDIYVRNEDLARANQLIDDMDDRDYNSAD